MGNIGRKVGVLKLQRVHVGTKDFGTGVTGDWSGLATVLEPRARQKEGESWDEVQYNVIGHGPKPRIGASLNVSRTVKGDHSMPVKIVKG